jgi:hypothetical protein
VSVLAVDEQFSFKGDQRVSSVHERLTEAAAKPVITPETIVCDLAQDGGKLAVPWIHHERGAAPFADFTLCHVRREEKLTRAGLDAVQLDHAAEHHHAATPPRTTRAGRRPRGAG